MLNTFQMPLVHPLFCLQLSDLRLVGELNFSDKLNVNLNIKSKIGRSYLHADVFLIKSASA